MTKYYKAGARYFMSRSCHHDHFRDYDSAIDPMNSVNIGSKDYAYVLFPEFGYSSLYIRIKKHIQG